MALLAGVTLCWPGTVLDCIWRLNPSAYQEMAPLGRLLGIPFLLLSAALAVAGIGWFRRRIWGWRLAVAIISIQMLGDLINGLRGDYLGGAVGVSIAGALTFYLLRPSVRAAFYERNKTDSR